MTVGKRSRGQDRKKPLLLTFVVIIQDVYGQTESWYVSFARLGEMKRSQKVQKVGPPVVNVEVKIVDEKGSCVPRNERGELWVRSCLVMIEYLGQPELTKDTVTSDGWLKSGYAFNDLSVYLL